ncbi:MAG TPA: uracil-DNA glycosylase [Acidimicrobiia bacterium]
MNLVDCRDCPRLVAWREQTAREKRAAFRDETYWGRPVPSFGEERALILLVGLAPAAHGGNRTGRMFTGDRSGDFLYRALHAAGLANQPDSIAIDDGLTLIGCRVTAAVRCAPPANKPTPAEIEQCSQWLLPELAIERRVVVALGAIAFRAVLRLAPRLGWLLPRPLPKFGHGAEVAVDKGPRLLASYHPSQQNTFTGKLDQEMLVAVLRRAAAVAGFA